ncbi:hypothetical protein [Spongiactinospora sp. 9N601]|uniref:hypothetical protein n=1 Tax=Spongiactinospora sp. 9N601 TaxID=3375149 RepID=UPI0037BA6884
MGRSRTVTLAGMAALGVLTVAGGCGSAEPPVTVTVTASEPDAPDDSPDDSAEEGGAPAKRDRPAERPRPQSSCLPGGGDSVKAPCPSVRKSPSPTPMITAPIPSEEPTGTAPVPESATAPPPDDGGPEQPPEATTPQ